MHIPIFLSRALGESESKMKLEIRANHTCALKECKPEVQHEFSAAGRVEHSGIYLIGYGKKKSFKIAHGREQRWV